MVDKGNIMAQLLSHAHRPVLRLLGVSDVHYASFIRQYFHSFDSLPSITGKEGIATFRLREWDVFNMADIVDRWKREPVPGVLALHFEEPTPRSTIFHKQQYAPITDPIYFKIWSIMDQSYEWCSEDRLFLLSVKIHLQKIPYRET